MDGGTAQSDISVMSRTILFTGLLFALVVSRPDAAGRTTHEFEKHTFSLDLPAGYSLQGAATPNPGFKTFGFTTEPRSDTTRGLIQVSVIDLTQAPPGEKITVDRIAEVIVNSVRQRRTRWEQTESEVSVGGVPAKRIAWSGAAEPGFGRPAVTMRGVMIVGIAKDLGFALHTQDVTTFADTTLPLCEEALLTFTTTRRH